MLTFNNELFLMDLDKIETNPEKIKFVVETSNLVRDRKIEFIQEQKFEEAAEWRMTERWLNDKLQELLEKEDSNIDKDIEEQNG